MGRIGGGRDQPAGQLKTGCRHPGAESKYYYSIRTVEIWSSKIFIHVYGETLVILIITL